MDLRRLRADNVHKSVRNREPGTINHMATDTAGLSGDRFSQKHARENDDSVNENCFVFDCHCYLPLGFSGSSNLARILRVCSGVIFKPSLMYPSKDPYCLSMALKAASR